MGAQRVQRRNHSRRLAHEPNSRSTEWVEDSYSFSASKPREIRDSNFTAAAVRQTNGGSTYKAGLHCSRKRPSLA